MSRGIGGLCRLIMQDENTLLYEYAPYNLNELAYKNSERIYDGLITIERSAFAGIHWIMGVVQ